MAHLIDDCIGSIDDLFHTYSPNLSVARIAAMTSSSVTLKGMLPMVSRSEHASSATGISFSGYIGDVQISQTRGQTDRTAEIYHFADQIAQRSQERAERSCRKQPSHRGSNHALPQAS